MEDDTLYSTAYSKKTVFYDGEVRLWKNGNSRRFLLTFYFFFTLFVCTAGDIKEHFFAGLNKICIFPRAIGSFHSSHKNVA